MGSFKINKYLKINASRTGGISLSTGVKGFRLNIGPKGIKRSVTVPYTGYTSTKTIMSFKKKKKAKSSAKKSSKASTASKQEVVVDDDYELDFYMEKRQPKGLFSKKKKADNIINEGIELFEKEDVEGAILKLTQAIEIVPEDEEVRFYRGVLYYVYLEDFEKALDDFDDLSEENLNADIMLAIADCLFETKQHKESIALLQSFEFDDEEDMERMTLMARNHIEMGNYEMGEDILKKVIGKKRKMTKYLTEAKYYLGLLYLRVGDKKNAEKYLKAVYMADISFENIAIHMEELGIVK